MFRNVTTLDDDINTLIAERDCFKQLEDPVQKSNIANELMLLATTAFQAFAEHFTENISWFKYIENEQGDKKHCAICQIPLVTGDKCHVSDCSHQFHADCMARYINRVDARCLICKTAVRQKIKLPEGEMVETISKMFREK